MKNRNNINFKRIRLALKLTADDVFNIMGGEVSRSQIDGWSRSEDAVKNASGNSTASKVRRFKLMSDEQFDRFCSGLPDHLRDVEK